MSPTTDDQAVIPKTRWEAYAILGVRPGAPYDEVRAAYRRKAWERHPDQGGKPAEWLPVAASWELLRGVSSPQGRRPQPPRPQPQAQPGAQPGAFQPSFAGSYQAEEEGGTVEEPPPPPPVEEEDSPPVEAPRRSRGQWRPGRLENLRPDWWLVLFAVVLVGGTLIVGTLAGASSTTAVGTYAAGWAIILLWRAYGRPWGR